MDFRMSRSTISPSSSSTGSGMLFPSPVGQQPHGLTAPPTTPFFYYPGLPVKVPVAPLSSPLAPPLHPSGLNGNHPKLMQPTAASASNLMLRSTATVQPSTLHPPLPQLSPHHHRNAPVASPSSGTSARHQHNNGGSGNSGNNSFAAALRHLATTTTTTTQQATAAAGPKPLRSSASSNHSDDPERESSPQRSNFSSNGSHGHPSGYNGERISKSPSSSSPHYRSTSRRESSGHVKTNRSGKDELSHSAGGSSTTRSRSPPVVTIAPTLSLSNLHYQDSRKQAYDRASMLCHTVPSSAGFGGGLSTGLVGLQGFPTMMSNNTNPYANPSTSSSPIGPNGDYLRTPDMPSGPFGHHAMPSYAAGFPSSTRAEDLFYGGLRSSMQQSAAAAAAVAAAAASHFRSEAENRNLSHSTNHSYHESLLGQLPSSRAPSAMLSQHQEDYIAARNSGFNPYGLLPTGSIDHSSLHPSIYSNPFASYRSLEEQLYLERYGLLRPGSSGLPSSMTPYPSPLGFPSYLNFRYPSPSSLIHSEMNLAANNSHDPPINRIKLEEEKRVRELSQIADAATSKSQESSVPNRPLATVIPRENNWLSGLHQQENHERQRDNKTSDQEMDPNRNSSSHRAIRIHTVSPLCPSSPAAMADAAIEPDKSNGTPLAAADVIPCTSSPIAVASGAEQEQLMEHPPGEFSLGALEAMAALKQRSLSSSSSPPDRIKEEDEETTRPLDLSETSAAGDQSTPTKPDGHDSVRSLLDIRVERWKRKRQQSDAADNDEEADDEDLDEESSNEQQQLPDPAFVSISIEQCLKNYPVPAGVSEEQHHFLHMFGLVTPQKRSEFELVKCIRRQNILREPTPPPIDAEDEDSATSLLKQRTRLSVSFVQSATTSADTSRNESTDADLQEITSALRLKPTDQQTADTLEKSWTLVVADRMKRHFGQRLNVRKRLWGETFRPLNSGSPPPPPGALKKSRNEETTSGLLTPSPEVCVAKLDPADDNPAGGTKPTEWHTEASRLTSEVAFWLRHLKPTMARTLTSSSTSSKDAVATDPANPVKSDGTSSPECTADIEAPTRWPGIDSVMVLYMAHQQELLVETKFLREHCERLHIQLAEGQATLSKLCLALSSSVEIQRRCKEEDTSALKSIGELESTLKMLQSGP